MHARTAERRDHRTAALVVLLETLLASGAHAGTALPPQGKRALLAWLKAGTYASSFTPEPEPHSSTSAHGPFVRTWYSPVLTEDLRAGRVAFRTFDGRNDAVSFGRGLAACTGCHRSGVDFLRSAFRP